ncbi:MAG TPA: response regulator transcription factor [Candidatus Dormibacteraeota bacterium]|nr:response regulator transcription factor [Candidatus Dormibacteraeota bacterium]
MRLLLCDDHLLFTDALAVSLQSRGVDVVACATTMDDAVRLAAEHAVDLCLVDVHFPEGVSYPSVSRILEAVPTARVVILSADSGRDVVSAALAAGATGFVAKRASIDEILEVLLRVHAGEQVVRDGGRRPQPGWDRDTAPAVELLDPLTGREQQVLDRLVLGRSAEAIAAELGIRRSTARTHIQNLMSKLGVHTKAAAVAFAVGNGLVPLCPADLHETIQASARPQVA